MTLSEMVTVRELADMLYRLSFPKRQFAELPESVQQEYVSDAVRLIQMFGCSVVTFLP